MKYHHEDDTNYYYVVNDDHVRFLFEYFQKKVKENPFFTCTIICEEDSVEKKIVRVLLDKYSNIVQHFPIHRNRKKLVWIYRVKSDLVVKITTNRIERYQYDPDIWKETKRTNEYSHPLIIKIGDIFSFEIDHELFVAYEMKYFENGTLENVISKQIMLSETNIVFIMIQIAFVLGHIQQKNKGIHRDIRLPNIFIDSKIPSDDGKELYRVIVADFEFLTYENTSSAFSIAGARYFAPEVNEGNPYSFSSDVFTLGVLLAQLMTLKIFDEKYQETVKQALIEQNCYSDEIIDLVATMIQKEPKNRPTVCSIISKGMRYLAVNECNALYQLAKQIHDETKDSHSQYTLGVMYYNGIGISRDYSKAFKFYEMTAKQGHIDAQYHIDNIIEKPRTTLGNTKYGFSFNFVISAGKQLVQGLKDIHMKMSLIHRDIKLDNIALDQVVVENNEIQSAIIKVIDFESAVSIQNQGALEEEMYHATESYRCPDNILLSTKSDIYALGLILFRMLFGPYGERDTLNVALNFKGQQDYTEQMKESLDFFMDDCRLKRLLKRMLSYNPHQRPDLDEIDFELSIINTAVDPPIPLPCLRINEYYRQKRYFEPKSVYLEDVADMFNVDIHTMTPENILSFCDNNECAGLSSDYFLQDTCVMIICKILNVEPHLDKNQTRKLCKLEKEHLNKLGYVMKEFELNLGQNLSRVNKLFEKQRKNKNPKEILDLVIENLEVNPNLKKTASDLLQFIDMVRPQLNLLSPPSSNTENIDDGVSRFLRLFPISNGSTIQNCKSEMVN